MVFTTLDVESSAEIYVPEQILEFVRDSSLRRKIRGLLLSETQDTEFAAKSDIQHIVFGDWTVKDPDWCGDSKWHPADSTPVKESSHMNEDKPEDIKVCIDKVLELPIMLAPSFECLPQEVRRSKARGKGWGKAQDADPYDTAAAWFEGKRYYPKQGCTWRLGKGKHPRWKLNLQWTEGEEKIGKPTGVDLTKGTDYKYSITVHPTDDLHSRHPQIAVKTEVLPAAMLKIGWPSTTKLALDSQEKVSDTTREQAGTPELIQEDPNHWRLASEAGGHRQFAVELLEDFAAYAVETADFLNESVAGEIEEKAQKAKAWRNERATWLKEQSEALKGKGHGKKKDEEWITDAEIDADVDKALKAKSKGKGKGTKKKAKKGGDDREDEEEAEGVPSWGPWPKEAQPRTDRAGKGSNTGKGKHTCIHCGKWGSHSAEICWENPELMSGAASSNNQPPQASKGGKKKGKDRS